MNMCKKDVVCVCPSSPAYMGSTLRPRFHRMAISIQFISTCVTMGFLDKDDGREENEYKNVVSIDTKLGILEITSQERIGSRSSSAHTMAMDSF